jgi:hypothetical protein
MNRTLAVATLGCVAALVQAQTGSREDAAARPADDDFRVAITQKIWAANWDIPSLGAAIQLPGDGAAPVIQTSVDSDTSSTHAIPVTSIAVKYRDFIASLSGSWRTSFSSDLLVGGRTRRSEYDVSVGYQLLPWVTASVIYKAGRTNQVAGVTANSLLGVSGRQKLSGWLVGVNALAPLNDAWSLYGNAAISVTGKSRLDLGNLGRSRQNVSYQIGEIGFAYHFPAPLGGIGDLSLQFGYRSQILKIRKAPLLTLSTTTPGLVLDERSRTVQTATHGFIIGVAGAF